MWNSDHRTSHNTQKSLDSGTLLGAHRTVESSTPLSKMEDMDRSTERLTQNIVSALFPAGSAERSTISEKQILFPSASPSTDVLSKQNNAGLDWLTNKSYTEDTEKKLITFQEELRHYQKKQSGIPSDVESSPEEEEERVVDRKRRHRSSAESSEEYRVSRMKKKKKHKHKKKHKKEKHKHKEDKEDRGVPTQNEIQEFLSKKVFLEELGDSSLPTAYRIDRQSDPNSWTYGSLYKPHIARYKHFSPFCLGSNKSKQVLLYDIKKSSKQKPRYNRYFGKDNGQLLRIVGEPLTTCSKDENDCMDNYVEIKQANEDLESKATDVRQRILDGSTSAYVKGEAAKEPLQPDIDSEHVKGPFERKVEDYNKRLREEPTNIELWLKFLKFQDMLFSDDGYGKELGSKGDEKHVKKGSNALLDKKLSILDKAFESNPASIELHLLKLELCSEIWEPARINKELEQLLFVHPANVALWNYYLQYNQSRLSMFTVSKVAKLYQKCFKTLFGILEGKVQTHSVPENLHSRALEIVASYCFFLKETGLKEKALTTVQALLEFNLFCPPTLKHSSRGDKMSAFEEYWESSCAKLGFQGCCGWKYWVQNKDQTPAQNFSSTENLEELEEDIIEKKLHKTDTWLQIEALREKHHWLPWQPDVSKGQTEEDCEDPERLVVFDDVSPVVYTVPVNLHFQLLNLFLLLCGVNLAKSKVLPMVGKSLCDNCVFNNGNLPELIDKFDLSAKGNCEVVSESLNNFVIVILDRVIKELEGESKTFLTLVMIEFQLLMITRGKHELSKSKKKELRKVVKNLLKEEHNRSNLVIWSAYVSVERLIGRPGEAESILETALTIHSGKDISICNEETVGLLSLYRMHCETMLKFQICDTDKLWERQECSSKAVKQNVIQILCCAIEGKKYNSSKLETVSSTSQLKIRARLKKLIEEGCASCDKLPVSGENGIRYTKYLYFLELCVCSGLFEYCSRGLDSSLSVYQWARSLSQGSQLGANLDLFKAELRLLLYHMACVSTPLTILRNTLDTAMSQHPNESCFLKLFVDVENRSRIAGRLQRYFDKMTRNLMSPVPACVAIWSQLVYLERIKQTELGTNESGLSQSGIVNKTRSWLERSLNQPKSQRCSILWKMYFYLEKQYGDISRLKGIFYRSIQQCPWIKELYLEGIYMFSDQLQELVDMMTEKELRVQIPVEELDILMSD